MRSWVRTGCFAIIIHLDNDKSNLLKELQWKCQVEIHVKATPFKKNHHSSSILLSTILHQNQDQIKINRSIKRSVCFSNCIVNNEVLTTVLGNFPLV